jgi:BASS family bile acid:Na+ symporter
MAASGAHLHAARRVAENRAHKNEFEETPMGEAIDQVRLNFNPQAQLGLNLVLALIMFGIALDLKVQDFKAALRTPKALAIGLVCHHVLFPAFTFGNAALSLSISTLSTLGAVVMTPLNVAFWASLDPAMNALLRSFSIDLVHMLRDVAILLGVPLAAGHGGGAPLAGLRRARAQAVQAAVAGRVRPLHRRRAGANWGFFLQYVGPRGGGGVPA